MSEAFLRFEDSSAERIKLAGNVATLGSGSACSIMVAHETVSHRHAILRKNGAGEWLIEDMGSTNGTWVNGGKIDRAILLSAGDRVALGAAIFIFHDGEVRPLTTKERVESLDPYEFEQLAGKLFRSLAFETIVTQPSVDGGVDVIAVNHGVIFRGKYLIQCKRYSLKHRVSRPEIVAFYGRIMAEPGTRGIFITSSSFYTRRHQIRSVNGNQPYRR